MDSREISKETKFPNQKTYKRIRKTRFSLSYIFEEKNLKKIYDKWEGKKKKKFPEKKKKRKETSHKKKEEKKKDLYTREERKYIVFHFDLSFIHAHVTSSTFWQRSTSRSIHTVRHLAVARLKGMIDAWHATDTPTTPGLRWIFRTIYPLNERRGAVSAGIPAISNNSYISWSTSWNNREMNSRERWKSAGRSFPWEEREGRRVLGLGSSVIRERLVKWIYVENGSFLFLIKVLTYSSTRSEKNIIRNLFIVVQFDFKSLLALNREMEYIQLLLFSVCVTK